MLYQLSYFRKLILSVKSSGRRWIRTTEDVRQQIYSLPHLATLVFSQTYFLHFPTALQRADGGIRTPDQLITNQLLWPTELHRHLECKCKNKNFMHQKSSDKICILLQKHVQRTLIVNSQQNPHATNSPTKVQFFLKLQNSPSAFFTKNTK